MIKGIKRLTPLKAIRQFCISCSGGSQKAPRLCNAKDCPLWAYRLRHNPKRRGIGYPKDFAHSTLRNPAKKAILLTIRGGKIVTENGEYVLSRLENKQRSMQ